MVVVIYLLVLWFQGNEKDEFYTFVDGKLLYYQDMYDIYRYIKQT